MRRRRVLMDIGPLRESPAFRALWLGTGLSAIGSQMTTFAVALQVYQLTGSSLAVGGVGLATVVPSIVLALVGGTIADVMDRRKLVLITSVCLALVSAAFAVQAFANADMLWLLYGLVAVQSLLNSVNTPVRNTLVPRLLPPGKLPAAYALNSFTFQLSVTAGPALAGLITAVGGLRVCYVVDAVSFVAALWGVSRLPAMPPQKEAAKPGPKAIVEGMRFITRSRIVGGAFLTDMNATILGMPIALFPAINAQHFDGSAQTLGLISAAPAVGGLIGSMLSGPVGRVSRQGRAMLLACVAWGLGLIGFGVSTALWLALLMLAISGAADSISVVFRATMVQAATPDEFRGRVSAADYVVGAGCPQLGNFRAGAVSTVTSPAVGVTSGGISVVVGAALIAVCVPKFARYRAPLPENADSVRL